jgi:hypothetical protein
LAEEVFENTYVAEYRDLFESVSEDDQREVFEILACDNNIYWERSSEGISIESECVARVFVDRVNSILIGLARL